MGSAVLPLFFFLVPGFGSDAANPHLPHNHEPNQVVYTGTHDNDTVENHLYPSPFLSAAPFPIL